jgi:hypothetical protein
VSEVIPVLADSTLAAELLSGATICYTDLDGTLLGPGGCLLCDADGSASTSVAEAIARLNSAGLTVVVCSGRNRIQVAEISRLLGWRGFIAELGCVLVPDRGATPEFLTGDWPPGAIGKGETPYAAIERSGAIQALFSAFAGRLEYHDPHHFDREATHVLRGSVELGSAQAILDAFDLPMTIVDNGLINPLRTTLVNVSDIHAYHVTPAGATKLAAVRRDLALRGLAAEDAVAIGDSATDIEMAGGCALGITMSNALADESVLAAAAGMPNVFAARGRRGDGWTEFANAWLAARGL